VVLLLNFNSLIGQALSTYCKKRRKKSLNGTGK